MKNTRSIQFWSCSVLLSGFLLFASCNPDTDSSSSAYHTISGETMGTTYRIVYGPDEIEGLNSSVDRLLINLNHSLSTYEENSLISRINKSDTWSSGSFVVDDSTALLNTYFKECFQEAHRIYTLSGGAFDPTVGPLVRYWGFGWEKEKPKSIDRAKIDSLRMLVGMDKLIWVMGGDSLKIKKLHPDMVIDFSAIAKGFAVDKVADLLNISGAGNYLIEIGGEVKVKGKNDRGDDWVLGIQSPLEDAASDDIYGRIALSNRAMATSGNYRNYYLMDDRKIFHTLNPQSGYPQINRLRSATIIHRSCMSADALATAAMVMGVKNTLVMIAKEEDAEAYLIFEDHTGALKDTLTPGFQRFLID